MSEKLNELLTDLQNELENLSNRMRINKLSLSASKSEYTVIGRGCLIWIFRNPGWKIKMA